MPTGRPDGAGAAVSADVAAIEQALNRIAYMITRARRHDRVRTVAGVPLERAAVVMLRKIAERGALRPGELAAALQVEAPHVTRQVRLLQRAGYVDCVPDPDDRRAQLIRLTPAGADAAERIREVATRAMQSALQEWSAQDLHRLAVSLHRMVDDFIGYAEADEAALYPPIPDRPSGQPRAQPSAAAI